MAIILLHDRKSLPLTPFGGNETKLRKSLLTNNYIQFNNFCPIAYGASEALDLKSTNAIISFSSIT
jgi:hypothetical protein